MMRFVVVVPGFVPGIRVFLCPCKDEDGLAMTAERSLFPYGNELAQWH